MDNQNKNISESESKLFGQGFELGIEIAKPHFYKEGYKKGHNTALNQMVILGVTTFAIVYRKKIKEKIVGIVKKIKED